MVDRKIDCELSLLKDMNSFFYHKKGKKKEEVAGDKYYKPFFMAVFVSLPVIFAYLEQLELFVISLALFLIFSMFWAFRVVSEIGGELTNPLIGYTNDSEEKISSRKALVTNISKYNLETMKNVKTIFEIDAKSHSKFISWFLGDLPKIGIFPALIATLATLIKVFDGSTSIWLPAACGFFVGLYLAGLIYARKIFALEEAAALIEEAIEKHRELRALNEHKEATRSIDASIPQSAASV